MHEGDPARAEWPAPRPAPRQDFTTNLEAVARGVRRLEEVRDPVLRDAVAAALRLRDSDARLDPAARARMRRQVLAAISPARLTFLDHAMTVFAILAKPTPVLLRVLAVGLAGAGLLASATVASADSLPDDALYGFKLAGEQLRLAIASTPEDRAAVEISIAAHRLDEAERLAEAGRDDATIDLTSSYGVSLATAAAELASVETLQPQLAALVTQLQAQLLAQQDRVGATVKRLAGDPRTAGAAAVLAAVGPGTGADLAPSAVRIADDAAAVTTRLATVAATRAAQAGPASPRAIAPAVALAPGSAGSAGSAGSTGAGRPNAVAATPSATPNDDDDDDVAAAPRRAAAPLDAAAARGAAQRAQRAADEALRAALRARENSRRTASPSSPRR